MRRLFIAEKPSLARAIADVLPQPQRRDNYLECGSDIVAWCAGHILELADAETYNPDFKQWSLDHLPIVPSQWRLSVKTPDLLKTIKALLPRVDVVVNAGDPDREGQLLVDEVLYFLDYRGPVDRVLISDLNPAAVRKALGSLQPNSNFRRLYDAAVGRQRADWLFGINMTRLYTVLGRAAGYQGGTLSVGRVQTPLLGLIVRRDLEIENFNPKPYFSLVADVAGAAQPFSATWRAGATADKALDDEGRLVDPAVAAAIERKTSGQPATIAKATRDKKAEAAPLPYSLAELQIDAGRRLGLNPQMTLTVCQSLYETHRLKALLRETDGIGTPATQAAIIQRLFDRKYIEEKKRQIYSTPTARALIGALPAIATQPDMTALWESTLRKVQEGQAPVDGFLDAVGGQLGELVTRAKAAGPLRLPGIETRPCRTSGCTGLLRKRPGKNGPFWACSNYPKCTFTEDVESHGPRRRRSRKSAA